MDAVEKRARELLAAEWERDGYPASARQIREGKAPEVGKAVAAIIAALTLAYKFEAQTHAALEAAQIAQRRADRSALTPPEGHVVVTRNEAGQAVAVTRQDEEGRILSVIAEFEHEPGVSVATLRALSDLWASDRSYTGSPVDDIRALIDEPTGEQPEVKP